MYNFVKGQEGKHDDSLKMISILEEKYHIKFPAELKDYYYKYDGEKINLVITESNGYECEIAKIVPIIADKMTFETIVENDRMDGFVPNNFYPIARDRGGNYYYWENETEKVYLLIVDDIEHPFMVADSINNFFVKLNNGK